MAAQSCLKQAGVDSGFEMEGRIDPIERRGSNVSFVLPCVPKKFSCGRGFAQHRQGGTAPVQGMQETDQHPLGDIEIRFARSRCDAAQAVDICLRGEI